MDLNKGILLNSPPIFMILVSSTKQWVLHKVAHRIFMIHVVISKCGYEKPHPCYTEDGEGDPGTTVADVHMAAESSDIPEGSVRLVMDVPEVQTTQWSEKQGTREENLSVGQGSSPLNEIMNLFGKDPLKNANHSGEMLAGFATRFDHALANGIDKELKEKLIEKYPPALNCSRLTPPILNEEIAGSLKEDKIRGDKYLQRLQITMAASLMSLYREIEAAMNGKREMENLANSANLIFESFHEISLHRRYLLSPSLNPQFKKFLENQPIDKFL